MDPSNSGGRPRGYSGSQAAASSSRANAPSRPLMSSGGSRESLRTPSSIRIRRLPSNTARPLSNVSDSGSTEGRDFAEPGSVGRRRSSSAPQRPALNELSEHELARQRTAEPFMPSIVEGQASSAQEARGVEPVPSREADAPQPYSNLQRSTTAGSDAGGAQAMNSAANAARTNRGLRRLRSGALPPRQSELAADREYDADVVSLLDLVDPEVQTLGTLTNMQNSLFVPDLGRLVNRKPTYDLTKRPGTGYAVQDQDGSFKVPRPRAGTGASTKALRPEGGDVERPAGRPDTDMGVELGPENSSGRRNSVSSQLTDSHYAVLPHGVRLEGWSEEDLDELNDYVRHLLHSRREGFKRAMRGFGKYVSKPLGLFVTVYATLVTLFGAAWVFCLIGWIYVGSQQDYIIEIIDLTLVALFALIGDGLAPFRVIDTYHMCYIAKYHHKTWELREQKHLPELKDHNDLPGERSSTIERDVEAGETQDDKTDKFEYTVLSPIQQRRLQYHQAKFAKTHTFYKPHETFTHHAFPLRLLVAIVVLLDFHSIFQVALGTCTWTIHYEVRPAALTAVILSMSLTCNIVAGILISIGDKRTRKKDVLERIFRQDLTKEAIKKIQHRHEQQHEDDGNAEHSLGVDVDDEARFGDVEGIELSRKSMEAKRKLDAEKPRRSLDVRRTKLGAAGLLAGKADELEGRGADDKAGGVGRSSADGRRVSVDKKGRTSVDRKIGGGSRPSMPPVPKEHQHQHQQQQQQQQGGDGKPYDGA